MPWLFQRAPAYFGAHIPKKAKSRSLLAVNGSPTFTTTMRYAGAVAGEGGRFLSSLRIPQLRGRVGARARGQEWRWGSAGDCWRVEVEGGRALLAS
jgi:hypothetical protein